jgi:hypothetical protein
MVVVEVASQAEEEAVRLHTDRHPQRYAKYQSKDLHM